jgi:hypothetical protein
MLSVDICRSNVRCALFILCYPHREILCRGGAPGRYCFRFSNKTGYITVDYTIMEGAGRSGVSVASRRLQVLLTATSQCYL